MGPAVNYSRCVARQTVTLISTADKSQDEEVREIQRRIVYYQIAYVNALRCHLREQEPWPELQPFPAKGEIDSLRTEKNVAAAIQWRMALLLQESFRRSWLDAIQLSLLDNSLSELANAQGGCERIKNTPMPKQYDYFPMLFVRLYCVGLPLNMVANLGWLTPIGSTIVGFVFLALDQIGREVECPFDDSIHDIQLTSICRTVEINLRSTSERRRCRQPLSRCEVFSGDSSPDSPSMQCDQLEAPRADPLITGPSSVLKK